MTFFSPPGLSYLKLDVKNLFWRTMHLSLIFWYYSDATTFTGLYWPLQERFRFQGHEEIRRLWSINLLFQKPDWIGDQSATVKVRMIVRLSLICDWWEPHWSDPLNTMASDGIFFFTQLWSYLQIQEISITAARRLFRPEIFLRRDEFDLYCTWTSSDPTLKRRLWRFPSHTNGSITDL